VTADFDDINKVATLHWKSSLTDIEGFRVCKDKKGVVEVCMGHLNHYGLL